MEATGLENQTQPPRQMVLFPRGLFPGWKNRDGTGLIFRLIKDLENLSFSLFGGAASVGGYLLLAIRDDTIPIYCLPHFHNCRARSTDFSAAKVSDLHSAGRAPQRPDRALFLSVATTLRRADCEIRSF